MRAVLFFGQCLLLRSCHRVTDAAFDPTKTADYTMTVHHIFIFTDQQAPIADELRAFGLMEGSRRVHPGQGTANRKFYFENFFLELLWVQDTAEFYNPLIKETGLSRRAEGGVIAPFGLCMVREKETDALFDDAMRYQPVYFPQGTVIEVLPNDALPSLPWTFRLPFEGQHSHEQEPLHHPNGVRRLTRAVFEYRQHSDNENFVHHFVGEDQIQFVASDQYWLHLEFDHGQQGLCRDFPTLCLSIRY